MAVLRQLARRHASVSTFHLNEDSRLSWKAVGILTYMLTRPDRWEIRKGDLVERHSDGRDAVTSGVRELREAGYVATVPVPGGGVDWFVSEVPLSPEEWKERLAEGESRETGNPSDGDAGRISIQEENMNTPYGSPSLADDQRTLVLKANGSRKKKRRKKRATSLPDGWSPNAKARERALAEGLDVEKEAERFEAHHRAKGSTFVDWNAAFTTWLLNSANWKRERTANGKEGEPEVGTAAWLEREVASAEDRAYRG